MTGKMEHGYDAAMARRLLVEAFSGYSVHRSETNMRCLEMLAKTCDKHVVGMTESILDYVYSARTKPRSREVFELAANLMGGEQQSYTQIAEQVSSQGEPISATRVSDIHANGMRKLKFSTKVRAKLESILASEGSPQHF